MDKRKILRASRTLQRLENAQDKFNEAISDLSDEELAEWSIKNGVTIEPSKTKERIQKIIESKKEIFYCQRCGKEITQDEYEKDLSLCKQCENITGFDYEGE